MGANTKENGNKMLGKDGDLKGILMEILIMVNLREEKLMEKGFTLGIMEKYMMVSGIMV